MNQGALSRKRKKVRLAIRELVYQGNDYLSSSDEINFKTILKKLRRAINGRAEYSAAAEVYLSKYRGDEWVDELMCGKIARA